MDDMLISLSLVASVPLVVLVAYFLSIFYQASRLASVFHPW
jgi:hypothetical protein